MLYPTELWAVREKHRQHASVEIADITSNNECFQRLVVNVYCLTSFRHLHTLAPEADLYQSAAIT